MGRFTSCGPVNKTLCETIMRRREDRSFDRGLVTSTRFRSQCRTTGGIDADSRREIQRQRARIRAVMTRNKHRSAVRCESKKLLTGRKSVITWNNRHLL